MQQPWDIPAATALYNIDRWGAGYFGINEKGHVRAFPTQNAQTPIDIMDVVAEAQEQGLKFPLLVRFQDLLRHRVDTINRAFASAVEDFK
jgi:arginine decarboxylase